MLHLQPLRWHICCVSDVPDKVPTSCCCQIKSALLQCEYKAISGQRNTEDASVALFAFSARASPSASFQFELVHYFACVSSIFSDLFILLLYFHD